MTNPDRLNNRQHFVPSQGALTRIPLLDLTAQFREIREDVLDAVTDVLTSQHFILGPEVEAFEQEIAQYIGVRYAVGCASGSDALLLAQMAIGIGPGDEVITTPFTFGATAGSIVRLGAKPVFIDIDPGTFNLDGRQLEAAVTPRTRAIMPVHLFGLPANMDLVLAVARKHNLAVIEDAAQAIGAQWKGQAAGSMGTFGCFSFFPSKNLGGAGDGGMVVTNDAQLAQLLRALRIHGAPRKYRYNVLGMNSRLDAIQAAILRVKLRHLESWTERRRSHAETYREMFSGFSQESLPISTPYTPTEAFHVYNQYTIRTLRRDELQVYLAERGINTEVYYPVPLHLAPAFAHCGYAQENFPHAERACAEVLSLPVYPELTFVDQRSVVTSIAGLYERDALLRAG